MTAPTKKTVSISAYLEIVANESFDSVDLSVRGEIDEATRHDFAGAIKAAILSGRRTVNLDLSKVEFMGSIGVNTLVRMRVLAVTEGVTFRLVQTSRAVDRVLEVTDLVDYFR
jgi:anti-anti-sigma factor